MRREGSKKPQWLFDNMKLAFARWIYSAIIAILVVAGCSPPEPYAQGQGLAQAGPIDPANGFPQFYQDKTGRSLEHCLDTSNPADLCGIIATVPNPAQPIVDDPPAAHSSLATRNSMEAVFMLPTDTITAARNAPLKQETRAFTGSITSRGGRHEAL